jgi:hypothetical protein
MAAARTEIIATRKRSIEAIVTAATIVIVATIGTETGTGIGIVRETAIVRRVEGIAIVTESVSVIATEEIVLNVTEETVLNVTRNVIVTGTATESAIEVTAREIGTIVNAIETIGIATEETGLNAIGSEGTAIEATVSAIEAIEEIVRETEAIVSEIAKETGIEGTEVSGIVIGEIEGTEAIEVTGSGIEVIAMVMAFPGRCPITAATAVL